MPIPEISTEDFDFILPDERIPAYPAADRSSSKLLVWQKGLISESRFSSITSFLKPGDLLVMNNTRVIPARILFTKTTGGVIEIFCLEPAGELRDYQQAMGATGSVQYRCYVGGAKKWKSGDLLLEADSFQLRATLIDRDGDTFIIQFSWEPASLTFAAVLEKAGELPLPPYFNRKAEEEDYIRYQTVYAEKKGSVAAPTAGLHFTPEVLEDLRNKGIQIAHLTLHVGAGTFKPVTADSIVAHRMHREFFTVDEQLVKALATHQNGRIIPVGTTSLRALESLYHLALQPERLLAGSGLEQWEAYMESEKPERSEVFSNLLRLMHIEDLTEITTSTSILIAPGYTFRVADGLITNFHLPKSTLILLVAAMTGEDWRKIYDFALENDFRFLSYGDSSLLLP
ncbi:MAG: hypothetical protein RL220_73 [Bacteroidota bacterium]